MSTENLGFTREQLYKLKQVFPEVVHGPNSTEESMRHYFGQQSVVRYIEDTVNANLVSTPGAEDFLSRSR